MAAAGAALGDQPGLLQGLPDEAVGEPDAGVVERTLADLNAAARENVNLLPPILAAVKAYATIGEICHVLRQVFGEHRENVTV